MPSWPPTKRLSVHTLIFLRVPGCARHGRAKPTT
jgi:hypothetical protein